MKEKGTMQETTMRTGLDMVWRSVRVLIAAMLFCACSKGFGDQSQGKQPAPGSANGAAGRMPAYYDGELFTVNVLEMPASDPLLEHTSSLNIIYASNDLHEEHDFAPIIDATQGDGFNPLWLQVLVAFNDGFTPHQFFSDEEMEVAASGANPEISLVLTDEVYRRSVVGGKQTRNNGLPARSGEAQHTARCTKSGMVSTSVQAMNWELPN